MTTSTAVDVDELHQFLVDWAGNDRIEIKGYINESSDKRMPSPFLIGTSRDAHGTVLRLEPAERAAAGLQGGSSDDRKWKQFWAKVAVRSGYCSPAVDPIAFAELVRLRLHSRVRIEFVFDTNALISGVGHWLVRLLGSRADLVRTVVTDFEVHDFGDRRKWDVDKFETFEVRSSFLAASRFLEHVHDDHPIWRRLDTEEETALFTAQSTNREGKSAGRDTLMLRAARRAILDVVPGLRRFFVTGDQNVARAALHELPHGAVIAGYVNPLGSVTYLSPYIWLPSNHDQGEVIRSNLATFIWEALCLCAIIEVRRSDGATLQVRAHVPGENQFPSTWSAPRMYLTEVAAAKASVVLPGEQRPQRNGAKPEPSPQAHEEKTARRVSSAITTSNAFTKESPPSQDAAAAGKKVDDHSDKKARQPGQLHLRSVPVVWPFAEEKAKLLPGVKCTPNVPGKTILKAFEEIVKALRERRKPDFTSLAKDKPLANLQTFLRKGGVVASDGSVSTAGEKLTELFASNDSDGVSQLCTAIEPYHQLIASLRDRRKISIEDVRTMLRGAEPLQGLARLLGQAVLAKQTLHDGSRFVGREEFTKWLLPRLDNLIAVSPMQEASVATLAQKALEDLCLSPVRFGRALRVALEMPEFANVEVSAGGTPEKLLLETVCNMSGEGLKFVDVSADELHGIRTLKKRLQ